MLYQLSYEPIIQKSAVKTILNALGTKTRQPI